MILSFHKSINELALNHNVHVVVQGEGRVWHHIKRFSSVELEYKPGINTNNWWVLNWLSFDNGASVVVKESGYLTQAIEAGSNVLIYDLDLCEDLDLFEKLQDTIQKNPEINFALAIG